MRRILRAGVWAILAGLVVLIQGLPLATSFESALPSTPAAASATALAAAPASSSGSGSAAHPVTTGVEDFRFESFSADYALTRLPDGRSRVAVEERIVAVFPDFDQNRGIIRAIPDDYDGVPLNVQVLSVSDPGGAPIAYEMASRGGFTELALGTDEYVHGRTSYVIRYTMENVVRAFPADGVDEFYWDVNGVGWAQSMGVVSARLTMDAASAEALTGAASCYAGAQGGADSCPIEQGADEDGRPVFEATASGLDAHETLTIAVGFTLGTFTQVEPVEAPADPDWPFEDVPFFTPQPGAALWNNLGGVIVLVLGLAGTGVAAILRFRKPAGASGRGIIIPQYTPPKGMNLMVASELVGRASIGVPAQLVDLAVRGNLRILDYGVTSAANRYTLQFLHGEGLDADERKLVAVLFGLAVPGAEAVVSALRLLGLTMRQQGAVSTLLEEVLPEPGAVAELGRRSATVGQAVRSLTGDIRTRLLDAGALVKRSPLPGILLAALMVLLIVVAIGLELFAAFLGSFVLQGFGVAFATIFILPWCLVACLLFAYRPPAVGEAGADDRDYLLGLRDYLQLAEQDRMRMLQSPEGAERLRADGFGVATTAEVVKLYEKLLPYAVLWGVEDRWSAELALRYGSESPEWFVSSGAFTATGFRSAIGGLGSSVSATTAPASSSGSSSWSGSGGGSFSSGSSGGGFSGGGGGGGGGGGR